jgi:hypothetical protein
MLICKECFDVTEGSTAVLSCTLISDTRLIVFYIAISMPGKRHLSRHLNKWSGQQVSMTDRDGREQDGRNTTRRLRIFPKTTGQDEQFGGETTAYRQTAKWELLVGPVGKAPQSRQFAISPKHLAPALLVWPCILRDRTVRLEESTSARFGDCEHPKVGIKMMQMVKMPPSQRINSASHLSPILKSTRQLSHLSTTKCL